MPAEYVILVDENDKTIGYEEKLRAHQNGGMLHRAFSIFIFNASRQMLLQRRARAKYHFGGLWTNTCCSHPLKGEQLEAAAARRLRYEMGIDAPLREVTSFTYRANDAVSGLTEHEFDHVYFGEHAGPPHPAPDEVEDWRWLNLDDLQRELSQSPQRFTPWFRIAIDKLTQQDLLTA